MVIKTPGTLCPDDQTFVEILTFLNDRITVKTSLISTTLGNFVNLGVLFLTMWINSCLSSNLQTLKLQIN